MPFITGNCGNTAKDSAGCILVGNNTSKGRLTESRYTSDKLNKLIDDAIKRGEQVWVKIK